MSNIPYENISLNIDNDNEYYQNINNPDVDSDENELEYILKEIDESSLDCNYNTETQILAKTLHYDTNYTTKQLLIICDYYGLLKEVKINKFKKPDIISLLLDFEENITNSLIVYKRKQLWYFMEELKNDKFMKKYILLW
jgi:hypothetical protein